MATKSDNVLSRGKKEFFRTKEKALQKFGKSRGYNDAEFETLWKRCEDHFQLLDNIKKYVEGYVRALTSLCSAEVKLSIDVAHCFSPKDQMYEASLRNQDTIGLLDAARAEYDRVIRDDFLAALADYLRQAGTLKRRKNERDRRKIDMDRYKHDYTRDMEKGEHSGAMQNKRKYGGMKIAFESLNAEMIHDIPMFVNDKDAFFQPLFARFLLAQADFYQRAAELYKDLLPCFQHIDRLSVHEHQPVITDDEFTVANEAIDLSKEVNREELAAERSNYRSVAAGGAPSSTGYMSQMGHAPPGSNVLGKPAPPSSISRGSYGRPPMNTQQPAQPQPQAHYPPPQQQPHQGYPPPQQPQQHSAAPSSYAASPAAQWTQDIDSRQNHNQNHSGYQPPQQPYQTAPPPMTAPSGPKKMMKKKMVKKGVKKIVKKMPPGPKQGGGGGGRAMPGPPGGGAQQATTLYPFQGQDATELTFQANEVVTVIRNDPGQEWWECELRGQRGLVPANYVQML